MFILKVGGSCLLSQHEIVTVMAYGEYCRNIYCNELVVPQVIYTCIIYLRMLLLEYNKRQLMQWTTLWNTYKPNPKCFDCVLICLCDSDSSHKIYHRMNHKLPEEYSA